MRFAMQEGRVDSHQDDGFWTCQECQPAAAATAAAAAAAGTSRPSLAAPPHNPHDKTQRTVPSQHAVVARRHAPASVAPSIPRGRGRRTDDDDNDDDDDGSWCDVLDDAGAATKTTTDTPFPNHYATLGLSVTADLERIHQAWRKRVDALQAQMATAHAAGGTTPRLGDGRGDWHRPSSAAVMACNRLSDAYSVLTHPLKKRAYDLAYLAPLQRYERARIAATIPHQQRRLQAVADAQKWRAVLEQHAHGGPDDAAPVAADEERFGWVRSVHGAQQKAPTGRTAPASIMSGDVVAGFVDGMDLG